MPGTGSRILIVEHDMDTMSLLYMTLLHQNYQLEASIDAEEILLRVERFRPDLMLVNNALPGFDSREICRLVKETFGIPIILIVEKNAGTSAGLGCCATEDVIEKPINTDLLLQKINLLLAVE